MGFCQRLRFVLLAGLAFAGSAERHARADDAAARCVGEAERAQVLRDEGHLVESRAEFAACGSDGCPVIVRRECLRWLADLDERSPSIIVTVKTREGTDVLDASVFLDNAPLAAGSLGRAVAINPGAHVVRATHSDYPAAAQQLVVREREKGRVLAIVLSRPSNDEGAGPPRPRTVPWLSWTLGSVAVLGGAGFGAFWASGMNEVSGLRDSCAPYCSPEQVDAVRPTFTAARVSLGVGIAAAVGAVLVYFLQPPPAPARARTTAGRTARGRLAPEAR